MVFEICWYFYQHTFTILPGKVIFKASKKLSKLTAQKKMTCYSGVLWDCDGTLTDSLHLIVETCFRTLEILTILYPEKKSETNFQQGL
jgi:hypothetical protein